MERYTMMQLVASLGVSLATIRSWLAQAEIVAQRDTYDPRCYYVSRADAERLALLHGRVLRDIDANLPKNLETAHTLIVSLREDIRRLQAQLAVMKPVGSISGERKFYGRALTSKMDEDQGKPSRPSAPVRRDQDPSDVETFPPHLVTYQAMAERHGVPTSNVEYALMRAKTQRLPKIEGKWRHGMQLILYALDESCQQAFVELFWGKTFPHSTTRPAFHECDAEHWPGCYCHTYANLMRADGETR